MSLFKEIPTTAGFPFRIKDAPQLINARNSLEDDFEGYLGVNFAKVVYSGTAALYLILEALKTISSKKTVIIPSFICPLVPLAIKRAGLNIEVCDINKDNFDFDENELENLCSRNKDILAIIPVHLGGVPVEIDAIKKIAKKYAVFLIEDCAQSLGAEYKGRKTGTFGDFAFISLCRGKGLTIYEGGVIVTDNRQYAALIELKIKELVKADYFSEGIKLLELLGYWVLYRPEGFWWIYRLPQLFWIMRGVPLKAYLEDYSLDFPFHKVSGVRKLMGHASFRRLEDEIASQREKAEYYIKEIEKINGVTVLEEHPNCKASYPYLTVLFDNAHRRNTVLRHLSGEGLGVSFVYALGIGDYDYLKNFLPKKEFPHSRQMAQKHISLSTSVFLKKKDMDSVLKAISESA